MAISKEKCILGVDSLDFLGHIVDRNGIVPTPKKVQGILDFEAPTDQKSTLRYLDMLNYYRQSQPKMAAVLQPLYTAAAWQLEKDDKFVWTPELQKAFDASKQHL